MNDSHQKTEAKTESPSIKKLEEFKQLFPGVISDGVLDAGRLGELLQTDVSGLKGGKERFGLMWSGRQKAIEALQAESYAALIPDFENSINWDTAQNVFIEGDNLEVLKLLQNAYNDKIKMIYIDPPYNTGNDFVYNDDFSDPKRRYLEVTGQVDAEGNRLTSNTETSGRKHSNWLTMMYPRLVLARNLLTEDGAIFISIDDNELQNLRSIMDEIFGPENFVGSFVWQSRPSVQNDTDFSVGHEYIIGYARNRRMVNRRLKESNLGTWFKDPSFAVRPKPTDSSRFKLEDKDGRGPYKEDPFDAPNLRPNLTYGIKNPSGGEVHWPPKGRCWRTTEEEYFRLLGESRISWGVSGAGKPKLKSYLSEKREYGEVPSSWLPAADYGSASSGTRELQKLFGGQSPFDTPKPTQLLIHLLKLVVAEDSIVLDFFSGSSSLAHAVAVESESRNSKLRSISVTAKEEVQPGSSGASLGYEFVSDIGLERLRLLAQISPYFKNQGLRVLRLGASNFKQYFQELLGLELFSLEAETRAQHFDLAAAASQTALMQGVALDAHWAAGVIGSTGTVRIGHCLVHFGAGDWAQLDKSYFQSDPAATFIFVEDDFIGQDATKSELSFAIKQAGKKMVTY